MPEPVVYDWDKVIHKNVRCEDNQSVGNIVAVNNYHIIVTSQGGMSRYRIPKSFVESYNGAEVILKLPRIALGGFKI
jgi:hypothetical protein